MWRSGREKRANNTSPINGLKIHAHGRPVLRRLGVPLAAFPSWRKFQLLGDVCFGQCYRQHRHRAADRRAIIVDSHPPLPAANVPSRLRRDYPKIPSTANQHFHIVTFPDLVQFFVLTGITKRDCHRRGDFFSQFTSEAVGGVRSS